MTITAHIKAAFQHLDVLRSIDGATGRRKNRLFFMALEDSGPYGVAPQAINLGELVLASAIDSSATCANSITAMA
jgi:hypothetical protein